MTFTHYSTTIYWRLVGSVLTALNGMPINQPFIKVIKFTTNLLLIKINQLLFQTRYY